MEFTEIYKLLKENLGDNLILSTDERSTPKAIRVACQGLLDVCSFLKNTEGLYFDSLSCLTGIDNGPEAQSMEVIYNLYSIPYNHHLMLKVELPRPADGMPSVPSLSTLWKTADWHEREAYDLVGIQFEGHPDLRRILLPADWEGHPLRKDDELQEKYHGIKVRY